MNKTKGTQLYVIVEVEVCMKISARLCAVIGGKRTEGIKANQRVREHWKGTYLSGSAGRR
jgi:hypothetical protein